jgi:hypothetical protein
MKKFKIGDKIIPVSIEKLQENLRETGDIVNVADIRTQQKLIDMNKIFIVRGITNDTYHAHVWIELGYGQYEYGIFRFTHYKNEQMKQFEEHCKKLEGMR